MEIMGEGKPGKWCDYTWYVQVSDRACRSMNRQEFKAVRGWRKDKER